ncbi:hypothetical protein CBOM_02951 [Ceraceosorus bombacis]|uniref:Uncharacterized protein n=1 Tax=Ceraceosorus bombacis TaxID=401625 RepID=A0A0P1BG52_9BASI|nr:hypothetical protein CBOM_02951 [Ceraceosorus bombacis]
MASSPRLTYNQDVIKESIKELCANGSSYGHFHGHEKLDDQVLLKCLARTLEKKHYGFNHVKDSGRTAALNLNEVATS